MNHLSKRLPFYNRYVALRHGESAANLHGIIVSDPHSGVAHQGLTPRGRQQVVESLARATVLNAGVHIYSSDFRRARETAEIVHGLLHCTHPITVCPALRERFFGGWEGMSTGHYEEVWAADARDPLHTRHGVESVQAVLDRMLGLVIELERQWHAETILLVSHGDPLQILETAFVGEPPAKHRSLPPLRTAEIRLLTWEAKSS